MSFLYRVILILFLMLVFTPVAHHVDFPITREEAAEVLGVNPEMIKYVYETEAKGGILLFRP